jgi:hypothetical protein
MLLFSISQGLSIVGGRITQTRVVIVLGVCGRISSRRLPVENLFPVLEVNILLMRLPA